MEFSLATLVSSARIVDSFAFASLAFLLYDHVLTFGAEVQSLFLKTVRFLTFSKSVHKSFCFVEAAAFFTGWTRHRKSRVQILIISCLSLFVYREAVAILSVQFILMTRIYAVYECNRRLLVLFGILFVAEFAGTLAVVDMGLPRSIPRPKGISTGCYVGAQPPLYFLTWIPAIICENILCLLMLHKAWTTYKNSRNSSLLRLIIRDNVLYFLTVFASLLLNCLVLALAPQNFLEVTIRWAVALPCSLGSRLMLNMRERIYLPETERVPDSGIGSFRVAVPSGLTVESAQGSV
ncbi:hypothetical protein JB92DRAFT_3100232 [Gautieria morchelliformis]|nr:hypothetical protein JB92DRAFT_3100232 [Gautieria morchelliformis]